jgi:DNA-binding transcriptional ArsR family regulator
MNPDDTATTTASRTFDYVPAGELDEATVRVACSPLPTVFTLTRDALQNGRRGTPRTWRVAALSRLRRRDAEALAPLTDARCTGWPGLLAANDAPRETLDDALERLAATPGTTLLGELESDPDVSATDQLWEPLRRDPDRWMRGYVDAVHRGWLGLEELWRRSTSLLEREVDRIDAALDRGVTPTELVTELSPRTFTEVGPRTSLVDGELRLVTAQVAQEPRRLSVPASGVIFAPMIAGVDAGILASPGGRLARIAYSVPGSWQAFDDQAPPPASLEALVGAHRSRLLRRLDRPHTAGELAASLGLRPSGLTFHVRALEAAGLIVRERRGRHVIVRRTERGHVLLALYERL